MSEQAGSALAVDRMSSVDGAGGFDSQIAVFLANGMPERHGISVDEYVTTFRKLWDGCGRDEVATIKILTDSLYESSFPQRRTTPDYQDPRTVRWREDSKRPRLWDLKCTANRPVPLRNFLPNRKRAGKLKERDQLKRPVDVDAWLVGVFDVLGFENMYRRLGVHRMTSLYDELLDCVRQSAKGSFLAGTASDSFPMPGSTIYYFEMETAYFSDTILLCSPVDREYISPFIARCSDLIIEAAKRHLPLRGAIGIGDGYIDKTRGVFLGRPVIDAHRLEAAQDWIGASLSASCASLLYTIDANEVQPYTPPCKAGTAEVHCSIAIDWPRRAREHHGIDPDALIARIEHAPQYDRYYLNARHFAAYSKRHRLWNTKPVVPLIPGALKRSILRARLTESPVPDAITAMLQTLRDADEQQASIADYLVAFVTASNTTEQLERMPRLGRSLAEILDETVNERAYYLNDVLLAASEAREGIQPLDPIVRRLLEQKPPRDLPRTLAACLPFLQSVASGLPLLPLPTRLPRDTNKLLSDYRKNPFERIDTELLLANVIYAMGSGLELDIENKRRLELLRQFGSICEQRADQFQRYMDGAFDFVGKSIVDDTVDSDRMLLHDVLAQQRAARYSVDEALCFTGSQLSRNDLMSLVHDAIAETDRANGPSLQALEDLGPPHDAVARFARALTRMDPATPGGLPPDVKRFLDLLPEVQNGRPNVDLPALCGEIHAALREGRQIRPYDDASLRILESSGTSSSPTARFLIELSSGSALLSVPKDVLPEHKPALEELVESVRSQDIPETSLDALGMAALRCRRAASHTFPIDHAAALARLREDSRDGHAVSDFLISFADGACSLTVPDLDDERKNILATLVVLAATSDWESFSYPRLFQATMDARLGDSAMTSDAAAVIAAMKTAGGSLEAIAAFFEQLAQPDAYPQAPVGLPGETLFLLAAARRDLSKLEYSRIAVSRSKKIRFKPR